MTLQVYRIVLIASAILAIGVTSYSIAASPARAPNYLGVRGLKRMRAIAEDGVWSRLEPFVRWLAARINPLVSQSLYKYLDKMLTGAGDVLGLVPQEVVAISILSGAGSFLAGLGYCVLAGKSLIYIFIATMLGSAMPLFILSSLETERHQSISRQLPWVTDLLALGLSAGLDFPAALRQVTSKTSSPDEPLIEEITFILQELEIGKTRKEAVMHFAERVPIESVKELVGTIVQAEERGNPLAEVLMIQAETSRIKRGVKAEELASKASVKLTVPMTLLLVAVMLLIVGPLMLGMKDVF